MPTLKSIAYNNVVVGVFSGLSMILLQPLEILKVTLIVNPTQQIATHGNAHPASSLYTGMQLIYRMGGIKGFYKGVFPASMECIFGAAVYFQTLDELNKMSKKLSSRGSKADFFSSAAARIVSTALTNPLAVIRTRMQIPGSSGYNSMLSSASKIYSLEGTHGFLKGMVPTMLKDAPFAGIYYALMNLSKEQLKPLNLPNSMNVMVAGMMAGMVATSVTHPFEVLRTIAQNDSSHNQGGLLMNLSKIWSKDGVKGLTKGLTPRLLKKPLANTLAFCVFDIVKESKEHS